MARGFDFDIHAFFLAFRQGLILVQAFLELTMYSRLASNPWQSCLNLLIVGIIGTSYHYWLFLLLKMIGKKKKKQISYIHGGNSNILFPSQRWCVAFLKLKYLLSCSDGAGLLVAPR